jgi:hypothetical protein
VAIYQRTMPGSSDLVRALSLHAILLRELGRHAEALDAAEAALTAADGNDDEQIRAMTALAVGAALVELRRDRARARSLLGAARAYYAQYPDVFQHYIDEIDALLRDQ